MRLDCADWSLRLHAARRQLVDLGFWGLGVCDDDCLSPYWIEREDAQIYGDLAAKRSACKSCGAAGRSLLYAIVNHLPTCDRDPTLTPQQRYALRRGPQKSTRVDKIKRRWAFLCGRCSNCTRQPARPGLRYCESCAHKNYEYQKRMRKRQAEDRVQEELSPP